MESNQIAEIDRLTKRIVKFSTNTKKSVSRVSTVNEISSRVVLLEQYWSKFLELWSACVNLSDFEWTEEVYDEVETAFVNARGELNGLIAALQVTPLGNVQQQPLGQQASQHNDIRMKAMEVPTFTGEIEDWISFRDLFRSMITNNHSLNNLHRLQHLRAACKGKASELIQSIAVVDGNFAVAWDALVKRYENERLIVSRLIERLISLPKMSREDPRELAKLLDGTNQVRQELIVMNRPVDHWDDWLVVETTRKLDYVTRLAWEKSIGGTTIMPTYQALDEFLSGILRSFEAIKDVLFAKLYINPPANKGQRLTYTHAAITKAVVCVMCQGAHLVYCCQQFIGKSAVVRREFAQHARLCYNCLSTDHMSRDCLSKRTCNECGQRHHTLLHINVDNRGGQRTVSNRFGANSNPFDKSTHAAVNNMCMASEKTKTGRSGVQMMDPRKTLLPTAVVTVMHHERALKMRALIDQGSQVSLISRQAVQRLGLRWEKSELAVAGVTVTEAPRAYGRVQLNIMLNGPRQQVLKVHALVFETITMNLPTSIMSASKHPDLQMLTLADEQYWRPRRIDLLLGAATFPDILLNGVKKVDGLVAQETMFGWILSGNPSKTIGTSETVLSCHTQIQLDLMLRRFWEQEEINQKEILSSDDVMCEEIYERTTKRASDGRYIVELPFRKGGADLGNSYAGAVRRLLQMEIKGRKYPEMYDGYRKFMSQYLNLGHMEKISKSEIDVWPQSYLPHHAVFKPDSTSTKLRVVFDATAATSNGKGLNEFLLTGPRLQETLSAILMRWRKHKVAISADIEKMYRQILVAPNHQDYQRIVWRERSEDEIEHYRLKTVTYGTASAPYMAVKTLQRLANDEKQRYPRAAEVVLQDFYVDDCITGTDSVNEAIQLKNDLIQLMTLGGLRLLKWSSNSDELLKTLPNDHIECRAPLTFDEDDGIKALGIRWYPLTDEFRYKVHMPAKTEKMTKREMLSEIARLFDPLGLLSPVIISAKIQVQELWKTKCDWDDELPEGTGRIWHQFQHELPRLEELRIPRWCHITTRSEVQLHGFSDASARAFAACVYARTRNEDGSVVVILLTAKTKVAPIKPLSIPRLELCGAVLLARLLQECRQALRLAENDAFAWTDSMTVLAWLRKHASIWPTYVANRVAEIQITMNNTQWQHVPGVDNPADCASRGVMPSVIQTHSLWWAGPIWLQNEQDKWPKQAALIVDEEVLETKKNVVCMVMQYKQAMPEMALRFSTWRKLIRITAYCRRMLPGNRHHDRTLQAVEIEEARMTWIRQAQQHEFGDVLRLTQNNGLLRKLQLHKLHPFVDNNGIMRVGGRLANAVMTYDEHHPAIMIAKNVISQLLITDAHERVFHSGPQNTINYLHQRYWMLNERREVRKMVHKCMTCAKARPNMQRQLMGDLPAVRVKFARPFLHTAVDFAGPIWSRTSKGRGQKAHKSWIAVFVCLSVKAVHLELVSDLSSTSFIAAFRRFTSRRGLCAHIYCDNGTNFVGANREMREQLAACVRDEEWRVLLADSGTTYHFSPPGSPHFNGLAEATVRMAKTALRKVIGESKLTFEEMSKLKRQ